MAWHFLIEFKLAGKPDVLRKFASDKTYQDVLSHCFHGYGTDLRGHSVEFTYDRAADRLGYLRSEEDWAACAMVCANERRNMLTLTVVDLGLAAVGSEPTKISAYFRKRPRDEEEARRGGGRSSSASSSSAAAAAGGAAAAVDRHEGKGAAAAPGEHKMDFAARDGKDAADDADPDPDHRRRNPKGSLGTQRVSTRTSRGRTCGR